jgi:hypothetical protein
MKIGNGCEIALNFVPGQQPVVALLGECINGCVDVEGTITSTVKSFDVEVFRGFLALALEPETPAQ